MTSDFRRKAIDLFRLAGATRQYERKVRLLALAQAWLTLANHEQRVRQLEVETERLIKATGPSPTRHDRSSNR